MNMHVLGLDLEAWESTTRPAGRQNPATAISNQPRYIRSFDRIKSFPGKHLRQIVRCSPSLDTSNNMHPGEQAEEWPCKVGRIQRRPALGMPVLKKCTNAKEPSFSGWLYAQ